MEELVINTYTTIREELVKFVFRKVNDRALAEDIVQDVFLKIHAKSGQIRNTEKISSWIFQITRNAIIDYYRDKSRTVNPVDIDWDSGEQDFNDCVAFCLNELIKTLPPKYREVLELTEKKKLSQVAVAKQIGVSYSGIKSRVQRGRLLLKEKLESLYHIKTDTYGNVIVCEDKLPCGCDFEEQRDFSKPF